MGQGHTIIDFGPLVAGVAAWIASRNGRRRPADLVTATARPRWVAQLATWAATAIWAVAAYLVFAGAMFAVYADQGLRGTHRGGGSRSARRPSPRSARPGSPWRALPQPVRCAAGRVRRFPGHDDVVADRFHHISGWALDPADQLQRQLPGRLRAALPLPAGPAHRPGHVPGRDRGRRAGPARPARGSGGPRLRRVAAAVTRPGSRRRDRGRAGQHRPARRTAWPSPRCTTRPTTSRCALPRSAATPRGSRCAWPRPTGPTWTTSRPPSSRCSAKWPACPARRRGPPGAATYAPAMAGGQAMTISGRPPVLRLPLGALGPCRSDVRLDRLASSRDELRLLAIHAFVGAGRALAPRPSRRSGGPAGGRRGAVRRQPTAMLASLLGRPRRPPPGPPARARSTPPPGGWPPSRPPPGAPG